MDIYTLPNFYIFIIHIILSLNHIKQHIYKKQKNTLQDISNGFPYTVHLCDKTTNDLQLSLLVDHLKNLPSFNFICYYAQYITHPLKVSPCWASGTILLLSIFSLLRIALTPSYIPSKLKLHRPILSVCLSSLSLSFFWLYPWKISSSTLAFTAIYMHMILRLKSKPLLFLSSRFKFFLLSNAYFHVDIMYVCSMEDFILILIFWP